MIRSVPQRLRASSVGQTTGPRLPRALEFSYFGVLLFGIMAATVGLSAGMVGGGSLLLLAILCLRYARSQAGWVIRRLSFPILIAAFFLAIQWLVHDQAPLEDDNRSFISWILGMVIIQSLFLNPGFLHRAALAIFGIGLTVLPFLTMINAPGAERFGSERIIGGSFANPNGLGDWFGFCCLYFAIAGFETKSNFLRPAYWIAAAGCLFVVGLSLSRGSLLAIFVGATIAFRSLFRHGFIPVVAVILFGWVVYGSGVFDTLVSRYSERGLEETGRFVVWPLAVERFLESPLVGVGLSDIGTPVPGGRSITPHNSFIYLGLAGGILPLALFLAYCFSVARHALTKGTQSPDGAFGLPLLIYTVLVSNSGDLQFMAPWGLISMSLAMSFGRSPQPRKRSHGGSSFRLPHAGKRAQVRQFHTSPR